MSELQQVRFEQILYHGREMLIKSLIYSIMLFFQVFSQNLEMRLLVSSYLSVCVRPHGTTRIPLDGFSLNLIFEYFSKICREISGFIGF